MPRRPPLQRHRQAAPVRPRPPTKATSLRWSGALPASWVRRAGGRESTHRPGHQYAIAGNARYAFFVPLGGCGNLTVPRGSVRQQVCAGSPGACSRTGSQILWRTLENLYVESDDHPEGRGARDRPGCRSHAGNGHHQPPGRTSLPQGGVVLGLPRGGHRWHDDGDTKQRHPRARRRLHGRHRPRGKCGRR